LHEINSYENCRTKKRKTVKEYLNDNEQKKIDNFGGTTAFAEKNFLKKPTKTIE